eukprot:TRINITY_DN4916_c0_g2_i2.p1 TRINITY_DN4916_c0_g2~~TRINITY_DN4916_c0_g2_i2.p1  ORF type:complete len:675 (+),score=321.68 TRINITY_DN4916_c0_g2_i2:66-2090(+)
MKAAAVAAVVVGVSHAADSEGSPIGKVLQMISDLEAKVIGEGEAAQKVYDEFAEFCEDRSLELSNELKTAKANVEDLGATIEKCTADIETLTAKIDDLASTISKSDEELKKAADIRTGENAEFVKVEKDLEDTIDTIKRASGIIEKEMQKGGSFAQLSGVQNLASALDTLVKASAVRSADAARLTALLQSSSDSDDEDEETAAPAGASYENKSGGILETLDNLQSKAEDELSDARKAEGQAAQNFAMKKQALTSAINFATKDMEAAKKSSAATAEKKSVAEGDLTATKKDQMEDDSALSSLHHDCMSRASDFETEAKGRGEELKALATAKKIIKEATGAAASLLQTSMATEAQLSSIPAVKIVRKLAFAQQSKALAKLAKHMQSAIQYANEHGSSDPFAKVKEMVSSMITKLEDEASADSNQKAFCDKELAEANAKKEAATTELEKLTTKVDQNTAASTKLKSEVAELQKELAEVAKSQEEMNKIRAEEKALYDTTKPDVEKGLDGIKLALKTLRDYYSSGGDNAGAGGGIVSLLEVCESDFSKQLAEIVTAEESAVNEYTAETKENELVKAEKSKDVEYKTKEAASLDKANTEMQTDVGSVQSELDAVNEGLASLEKQCVGKVESYAEKTAKREKEIEGLKDALSSLSAEGAASSLLQSGRRVARIAKHLRGQ